MSYTENDRPLVQWSFLQFKKTSKNAPAPIPSFLHSATQIGTKILIYGGCDYYGDPQKQLFLYDTSTYQWSAPSNSSDYQEDDAGPRYGHTATLIEMHPPKIIVYGGISGGTFEFDEPNTLDDTEKPDTVDRNFMKWVNILQFCSQI